MLFPGTSHERLISSRSLALSLFESLARFLPFSRRRSNASTSLSVLVSAKSSSTISSRRRVVRAGMATATNPNGRARAHGAQERYRREEWARRDRPRGRLALRLERSRTELALKAGRTQPQLAERTARRDAMAREEGSKHLLGRRKSTKRRARRDVLELVHSSPVSIRLRSLFDRRYSPHHPRTAAAITQSCSSNAEIMSYMRTSRNCDVGSCGEWIS